MKKDKSLQSGFNYRMQNKTVRGFVNETRYSPLIDAGRGLRIVGKNVSQIFLGVSEWIELFASNRPYAEYQQKTALRQFRIGQVINPVIQAACLSGSNLVSTFISDAEIRPFRNKLLYNNPSQKTSVELAFREKNFFFIQGPPGTGKTTVIRELVDQVLESGKESRVLILLRPLKLDKQNSRRTNPPI